MKKMLLLLFVGALNLTALQAQESSKTADFVKDKMVFDVQGLVSTCSKTHLTQSMDLGLMLTKGLYAFAKYENSWLLYKENGDRLYCSSNALGGGLGYRCFYNEEYKMSLDARLAMGKSIGSKTMDYTLYDASLHFRLGGKIFVPTVGLGFRHENMHTIGLSNQNYMYLSFGIGL